MNINVKKFLFRGFLFSGTGPLIAAIIYAILELAHVEVSLNGYDVALAIVSTLVIAFVHAGASVFPQIEHWSTVKGAFVQGICTWAVYLVAYLVNRWIPFNWLPIIIFTGIYIVIFGLIWLIVFFTTKKMAKRMNEKLTETNKENQ